MQKAKQLLKTQISAQKREWLNETINEMQNNNLLLVLYREER